MPPQPPPFKPLNPWGRAMPKVKRKPALPFLVQVYVETDAGEHLPISPKWSGEDAMEAAGAICEAANTAILKRIRPEWVNAYLKKFQLVPN